MYYMQIQNGCRSAQEYILRDCDLLPRIIGCVLPLQSPGERGNTRPPLIGHLMQIAQCIQTLVTPVTPDGADGSTLREPIVSDGGRLLQSILHDMPYFDEWRNFVDGPYASLIAVQNAVPIISEAKASDYLSSSNLAGLPGSNFQQAIFGDRAPENGGFFDDDDDDDIEDEDTHGANPGSRFPNSDVDFAQFDFAPAADKDPNIFSFASFDDPNVFSPDPLPKQSSEGSEAGE